MVIVTLVHEIKDFRKGLTDVHDCQRLKGLSESADKCRLSFGKSGCVAKCLEEGDDDDDDDALTFITVSTPRSRLGSELLFEDLESIMQGSHLPPVGTTKPPLYPCKSAVGPDEKCAKRTFKRLVNKPISLSRLGVNEQQHN